MSAPPLQDRRVTVGSVVAGKYRVEKHIGAGGMGYIVVARHVDLDECVALKFLLTPDDRSEEFRARFLREAQVTAKLRSEHVARTLDFGVTDAGDPFIVMEYLQGLNLRALLRESGPLPVDIAVQYSLQACEGLAEAHRMDVVHRDLKPANLFLTKHLDGGDLLKIVDFGVAKMRRFAAAQAELTAEGTLLGSPKYMSPEQLIGAGDVDQRADIWSVGAILYEMLTGSVPFPGRNTATICMAITGTAVPQSIRSTRPEVPEELERAVMGCLERDITRRTENVAVLARALAQAVDIDRFGSSANAVEGVLARSPLSVTGASPAFNLGQSGPDSSSRDREAMAGEETANEVPASPVQAPTGPARSRTGLVFAMVGLVAVAIVIAVVLQREPSAPSTGIESASSIAPSASPAPAIPSAAAADAGTEDAVGGGAKDAAADGPADSSDAHSPRVRSTPPVVATHRSPPPERTAVPTATATKKPNDPFNSRY